MSRPILTETELEERLTHPSPQLIEDIRTLKSPLVLVGAGGKMGPTLAVLARNAAQAAKHPLQVIAASRFRDTQSRQWLEAQGISTHSVDLLDPASVAQLPDSENVIYLAGQKFGTSQNPGSTWAINTLAPYHFMTRYRGSRVVALSTGNVYAMSEVARGGAVETDPLTPLGEYPNAAVARERIFQYAASEHSTPLCLLRLYYAYELRYGVLADLARWIAEGTPIPLGNGHLSCIWQGDANEFILRSFKLASLPASAWNLCGPQVHSVRELAMQLGQLLGRQPVFTGHEATHGILGNSRQLCEKLGAPSITVDQALPWIAHWIRSGGKSLNKPTHFEVRDGQY